MRARAVAGSYIKIGGWSTLMARIVVDKMLQRDCCHRHPR